jgi:membrane fusion protein, heavy metal efflux system
MEWGELTTVEVEKQAKQDEVILPRRLSRSIQFGIMGVIAVLLIGGLVVGPRLYRLGVPRSAPAEASAVADAGTFRPTAQQWAGLTIAPIEAMPFRDTRETDGIIAIDDDLTTPVFSPYSGRVTKLFAKAGDNIARGAALFAVAATEFVQGQNDVISAAARTARAQLNLSQTNEKRQHDLYLAQGGALKDWQQSQVDFASAQGGFATTQIALAAARNRLRILGRTPAEIETIETAPDTLKLDPDSVVAAPISGTVITRQLGLGQNIVSPAAGGSTAVFQIGDLSRSGSLRMRVRWMRR